MLALGRHCVCMFTFLSNHFTPALAAYTTTYYVLETVNTGIKTRLITSACAIMAI